MANKFKYVLPYLILGYLYFKGAYIEIQEQLK